MSSALDCNCEIEFKFYEPKYLNSNYLNSNLVTVSSFFVGMLKVCGLVHPVKHNELCPALHFRGVTLNIRCSGITLPRPFFHSPLNLTLMTGQNDR
jgi:hypothetical protein